jgi:hypothetical protein
MPAPCATPERALADEFGITLEEMQSISRSTRLRVLAGE